MEDSKSVKLVYVLAGWLLAKGVNWSLVMCTGIIGFVIGISLNLVRWLGN